MSPPASTWISVALGAVMGGLVGFYDASHAEEAPQHPSRGKLRAPPSSERPVASPVFVQVRSAAPRAEAEPPEPPAHVAPEHTTAVIAQGPETPPQAVLPSSQPAAKRTTVRSKKAPRLREGRIEELADAKSVFRAESACARQDPEQCLRAARAFSIGVAIPRNPKSAEVYWHNALRIYQRGCNHLDPLSCVGLGAMYESGGGQQRNYATEVLQRARGICKDRRQSQCDGLDDEADKLRAIVKMPDVPSAPSTR